MAALSGIDVMLTGRTYTAFSGVQLAAAGALAAVVERAKEGFDRDEKPALLVFDDQSGVQIDFDLRGTKEEALARLAHHPHVVALRAQEAAVEGAEGAGEVRSGPGRPKLGVVSREVSLLPRHWAWLEQQPGGISGALRRLVDEARKANQGRDRARAARDAAHRIMWALAGNFPGFEEASRALYAGDLPRFERETEQWPADIRQHLLRRLREAGLDADPAAPGAPSPVEPRG
jgi:hypothetical protein